MLSLRSITALAVVAMCCLASVAMAQDSEGPVGPITTNNGASACVEFGSCTQSGDFASTETQLAPITSPASSIQYAAPTNSAESLASLSNLAATGAAAAYSSRVANGQGSGNVPDGATSQPPATVIAGTTPSSAPGTTGTGASDASFRLDSGFDAIWTAAVAFVAIVAGALVVL